MRNVARRAEKNGPSTWALLRSRDFAIYWWSGLISSPGNWLHNVTASVLMLAMTGSPFMVGVLNFATFIPTLLFSLPAGSLGDRVDKRRMVQVAQLGGGLVAAGLTVMSATGHVTPAILIAACFLIGTANAVNKPPMVAMIPLLVPRAAVARATATNIMQFQFGQIVGPLMASVILFVGTPTWGFGINAVSFLAPVIAMQLIHLQDPSAEARAKRAEKPGGSRLLSEGVKFILRSPTMPMILVAVVLTNACVEALRTLAPTIADDLGQPEVAGIIIMGYSIGGLGGLIGFGLIERVLPRSRMLMTAFVLQAAGAACVAFAPNLPLTVLGAIPIGIGFSLSTPLLSAQLQALAPDDYRSRVMSAFSMAHLGLRPLFALVAGALATLASTTIALAVFGVVAAGSAILVQRRRVVADTPAEAEVP